MTGINADKNRMPYNKRARKAYEERNYKRASIVFKIDEMEKIDAYCKKHDMPKNTLFREAVMEYIEKPNGKSN